MYASVRSEETAQEGGLNLDGSREDRLGDTLLVSARRGDAEAAEELAHGLAAGAELQRAIAHLLARDSADQLAKHPLVGVCDTFVDVISAVDPHSAALGETTVADQMAGELPKALAPGLRQLLIGDRAAPGAGLGERLDLDRQLPSCVLRGSRAVIQQHAVIGGQILSCDVAAVERPQSVVRSAAQVLTVREPESHDRLDGVAHDGEW